MMNYIKNFGQHLFILIGKDILRFHAIYWPAFLLAAKIDLPKKFMDMVGYYLMKKKCLNQKEIF